MGSIQLDHIYQSSIRAAIEASAEIMKVYNSDFKLDYKDDGSIITKADLLSSEIISQTLSSTNIPITGEERTIADFNTRSQWEENWCVDPLDGTKMFAMRNGEFSINIAHIKNGQPVFGLIASPVEERIIIGVKNVGVFTFNYKDVESPELWRSLTSKDNLNQPVTITCSRSFSEYKYEIIRELEKKHGTLNYLRKGSALKFFDLAEGKADIYLRFAPTMEWDIAAGHAIIDILGGQILSLPENRPFSYNKENLFNPHFIVRTKAALEA